MSFRSSALTSPGSDGAGNVGNIPAVRIAAIRSLLEISTSVLCI